MRFGSIASFVCTSLLLAACSGGGGSSSNQQGSLFVEFCSIGCTTGQSGDQISCSIGSVYRNGDIVITFSDAINPSSLNPGTLQVLEEGTGTVPDGVRIVDPQNPRRVIFRPGLAFDNGIPEFEFDPTKSYSVFIPGSDTDPAPYIRSTDGRANRTRMRCVVTPNRVNPQTGGNVVDLVPGRPNASILVDRVDAQGNIVKDQVADGAEGVSLQTRITVIFDDVMNPATLGAGLSPAFIRVFTDDDGDLTTPTDQVEVSAFYSTDINLASLTTRVVITPTFGLPSSGVGSARKTLIVVPEQVQDLVGNAVRPVQVAAPPQPGQNADQVVFTTISEAQAPLVIAEDFTNDQNLNQGGSFGGGRWGFDANVNQGRVHNILYPTVEGGGGGSGRLGSLTVRAGQVVMLSTECQEFPLPTQARSVLDNFDYATPGQTVMRDNCGTTPTMVTYDPADRSTWPVITVTDGIFEFEDLFVEANATLMFVGSNPARVFARGQLRVDGRIDVSGGNAPVHDSSMACPSPAGQGGPNAGTGGLGGTRFNQSGNNFGDTNNDAKPLAPSEFLACEGMVANTAGQDAGGVANVPGSPTRGRGGVQWPAAFPTASAASGLNGLTFDEKGLVDCYSYEVGGPGSGGAYNSSGSPGIPMTEVEVTSVNCDVMGPNCGNLNKPSQTTPGDSTGFLDDAARTLDPFFNVLRGGGGGGGGGCHTYALKSAKPNLFGNNCLTTTADYHVDYYRDHSGASGGGGGGALEATAGDHMEINGVIDASGGDGGSSTDPTKTVFDCTSTTAPISPLPCGFFAAPGGGGAGGGIRLLALDIAINSQPARLDVRGGMGGLGVGSSTGGNGGYGLVHIQDRMGSTPSTFLTKIAPDQSADPMQNVLTVASWATPRRRPDSISGAMSCWNRPPGSYFKLRFDGAGCMLDAPPPGVADPTGGWDMTVLYEDPANPGTILEFPYRTLPDDLSNWPIPGNDTFQNFLGNMVNSELMTGTGSFVAVRFQGARINGPLDDPCSVDLDGLIPDIVPDSLTPWVASTADLDAFSPPPNMFRFAIVFDTSMLLAPTQAATIARQIRGFTDLRICVQPD